MSRDLRSVLLLIGVVLLLWSPRLRGPIDLRWDAGVYYVLGSSLAEGRGYRLLSEPGEIQAVQYPPGLPLLVASVQRLLGTGDTVAVGQALRLVFLALSLAWAVGAYALARVFLRPGLSLLSALLATLHPLTVFLSDACLSEIPYGFVGAAFLLAALAGSVAGAGALGWLAALLRTPGATLLAAWTAEALLRRRVAQAALRGGLSLVPLMLWGGYVARVTSSRGYEPGAYPYQRAPYQYYNVTYTENLRLLDPFRPEQGRLSAAALAARVAGNLAKAPLRLGEAVSAPGDFWQDAAYRVSLRTGGSPRLLGDLARVLRALLGLTAIAGLVVLARGGRWLLPLAVLGAVLATAVTPWPRQHARYLAPLAPVLGIPFLLALERLLAAASRARRLAWVAAGSLLASALLVQAWSLASIFRQHPVVAVADRSGARAQGRLFFYDDDWLAYDRALDWLAANGEPGVVVATSAPYRAYLRTGLKAVMPPMENDPVVEQRLLEAVPARYAIEDQLAFVDASRRYLAPALRANAGRWRLVYEDGGVRVHRLLAAGS